MKLYDPTKVKIVIAGVPIAGGFADGSFVQIKAAADDFSTVVGTDGETTRNALKNRNATVTIRLMQSADANAALSVVSNLDRSGAFVPLPMLITDLNGNTLYAAAHSWIQRPPDVDYDKEAKEREWVCGTDNLTRNDGAYSQV